MRSEEWGEGIPLLPHSPLLTPHSFSLPNKPRYRHIPRMAKFEVVAPFTPAGDQPRAIAELTRGLARGDRYQTLLGVTGSGKTMTLAHVIAEHGRPTLVLSHNKTLAAQLYGELKQFLPANAVEYFVSYYDYYQPEAYVPSTDVYIEKDASINETSFRLYWIATSSLMERDDVVIVATVSAIYGLGDPATYRTLMFTIKAGEARGRDGILGDLVAIQYNRNDVSFEPGTFRVRGDTVEIYPAYAEQAVRVELWGDRIERIAKIDPVTGNTIAQLDQCAVYPAKHFVTERPAIESAVRPIRAELPARGGEAARGAAPRGAHQLRRGDAPGDRHLPGNRELFPAPHRTGRGRASRLPARLFSGRLSGRRGRVPRLDPPDRGHVQRRPGAEADPGGLRLPAPVPAGQPAAPVRGVHGAGAADDRGLRHPGGVRARTLPGRGGGADHPADLPGGPRSAGAAGQGAGGRSAQRDPASREAPRAGAGDHAHQEDGGGSHRLPPAARRAGAVSPFRHRRHGAGGNPARAQAGRVPRAGFPPA